MITFHEGNEAANDTLAAAWSNANSTPGKPCAECGAPFDPDSKERECRTLLVKLRDGVSLLYAVCNDCFDHYGEFSYTVGMAVIEEWPKITEHALSTSDRLVVVL
jgi:hypothetical protein